jgi:hypothetical protein
VAGVFYFKSISLSEIAAECEGKNIDIYLLDVEGVEIASALGGTVTGSTYSLLHPVFTSMGDAVDVLASTLDSIALEIAD